MKSEVTLKIHYLTPKLSQLNPKMYPRHNLTHKCTPGFYAGIQDLDEACEAEKPRNAQRAFSRISVAYDHYLKAGDLYNIYEDPNCAVMIGGESLPECWSMRASIAYNEISADSYIAPGIDAPGISDEVSDFA